MADPVQPDVFEYPPIPTVFKDEDKITLANKPWAVPPMMSRTILAFIKGATGLKIGAELISGGGDELETLYKLIHCGLVRAYPDLDFDTFMSLPIMPEELLEAFPTVAKAAGMQVAKMGESEAAPKSEPETKPSTIGTI